MKRLVHTVTVPESLRFLRGQPRFMHEHGYETHIVCSESPLLHDFTAEEGAHAHPFPFRRNIAIPQDAAALLRLSSLVHRLRPDVVHAQTPKAGLLGAVAARLCKVPRIIYHIRGLPMMSRDGLSRKILRTTERAAASCADTIICQSPSLCDSVVQLKIAPREKLRVLANGGNGVDCDGRFNPHGDALDRARLKRAQLAIPAEATVIGFVGRIVRDKGINELLSAWSLLRVRAPNCHLVLVGPIEPQDPISDESRRMLTSDDRIHVVGETEDVAPWYLMFDVLALPSYREGFPNAPMEAAAMGVPTVATRVPGCVDAVVHNQTGVLVPPRDAAQLFQALLTYVSDAELRQSHGQAAQDRVKRNFRRERLWEELLATYESN